MKSVGLSRVNCRVLNYQGSTVKSVGLSLSTVKSVGLSRIHYTPHLVYKYIDNMFCAIPYTH